MDDWERGMTMKKFDCSIGKKLAVPLLCFAFLLPAGECALGAEPLKWTENKADVRIYQTELSDFYEISFLNFQNMVCTIRAIQKHFLVCMLFHKIPDVF